MRAKDETSEDLGADGSTSGVEREDEFTLEDPFDPASISIDTKVVSMDAVVRRLRQGTIRLAPNFQRGFVWDSKRQSRLIESLMLRIPLPMFYVAADPEGNWDVVDGLQRLTTIRNFILGDGRSEYRLIGLEFWGDRFDGKSFHEIEQKKSNARIVNNIMETEMRFTVINSKTPDDVKFNVFKRINTGGMPLTNQEIRHALCQGAATELLKDLVDGNAFKRATSNSIDDSRMAGRELLNRFFVFAMNDWELYDGDMEELLALTLRRMNTFAVEDGLAQQSKTRLDKLKTKCNLAMRRALGLFGTHAFRKSVPGKRRTPVNKALFETWANILSDLSIDDFKKLHERKIRLFRAYGNLLEDEAFISAIGKDALRTYGVRYRFSSISNLVKAILE